MGPCQEYLKIQGEPYECQRDTDRHAGVHFHEHNCEDGTTVYITWVRGKKEEPKPVRYA